MICMFYLTGEVIDDKITTQCNGEDRYMSNLIKSNNRKYTRKFKRSRN